MTLLTERWPRLSGLPRVELAQRPTPLESLEAFGRHLGIEVWCKRDDLTSPVYGGNKVRKLEHLLAEARDAEADTILTAGALGSHHVLATAIHAKRLGMRVHAVVGPQPRSDHAVRTAAAQRAAGAELHTVPTLAAIPAALAAQRALLAVRGKRVRTIGPGGSEPSGVIGYVEAGLEIADTLARGACPEPDAIYVPLGTGGTAVGLAIGLAAAGVMTRIVAVRVTPRALVRAVALRALAHAVVERLRMLSDRFPAVAEVASGNLTIDERYLGEGYGRATGAGREAARLAVELGGITLDPTYTGKTMAALVAAARAREVRRALFVHTLSAAPIERLVASAPQAPASLERLWR